MHIITEFFYRLEALPDAANSIKALNAISTPLAVSQAYSSKQNLFKINKNKTTTKHRASTSTR